MGILKILLSILLLLVIAGFAFYYIESGNNFNEKDAIIQNLEQEKTELEATISSLEAEREQVKALLLKTSEEKEAELKNPTWNELKLFLELDDVNEMVYSESFDCSGFAIELFKRARNNGYRCGFVEIEYEEETTGHMLNIFRTVDKGVIFIDVSGDESGTGNDKVAYAEIGKPYGTIQLDGLKEKRVSCGVPCSDFATKITYVDYTDPFDYEYFIEFNNCIDFYKTCTESYNAAVDEYNKRTGKYTYSEIQNWLKNLKVLEKELVSGEFYFLSEAETIKSMQTYW